MVGFATLLLLTAPTAVSYVRRGEAEVPSGSKIRARRSKMEYLTIQRACAALTGYD